MRKILTALVLGGAGTFAFAAISAQDAPQLPGAVDVSRVSAGTYSVDPIHTLVGWRVNHFGFNDYFGFFGELAGTLSIDPADLSSAQVDVTIPIASITTPSAGLNEHLMRPGKDGAGPDFFGPDPAAARFVSTMVTQTGPTTAQIVGDLTLNGVTAPAAINATFTGAGTNPLSKKETIGFEGRAMLKRTTFGLNLYVPLVSDEVELDISVAFEKQ